MKRTLALCTSVVLGLTFSIVGSAVTATAGEQSEAVTVQTVETSLVETNPDVPEETTEVAEEPVVEEPPVEVDPAEEPPVEVPPVEEDPVEIAPLKTASLGTAPVEAAPTEADGSDADLSGESVQVVSQLVLELAATYPIVTKVTFCHATASEGNPFVRITTSVNAFFNAGHHEHQDNEDVVPPFSYLKQGEELDFHGLNYDQEFIDNGCSDEPSAFATASIEIVPADCEQGDLLILGDETGTNATWGAYTDLEGPIEEFEVISTAVDEFLFEDGEGVSEDNTTKTFTGPLAGPQDPESEECSEPEVLEEPEQPTELDEPRLAATGADAGGFLGVAALLFALGIAAVLRSRRMAA